MKVIVKGAGLLDEEIEEFFMKNILPVLNFGIAIEHSSGIISVHEKVDGEIISSIDPTAEVVVELTEEARNLAKDMNAPVDVLREKSGDFFDEAMAIRKIEELKPVFSIEYYSCRYTPSSTIKK